MLVMLCRIFKRSSDAVRTLCTHIQPKSWSSLPASEEGLQLKGDKLSWQPCQALQKNLKDSLYFIPTSQKIQLSAFHSCRGAFICMGRRISRSDMGLQPTSLILHLGHFQT